MLRAQTPPSYQMTYKDRSKGYMQVYGRANIFAPLVELGIAGELSISHSIFQIERMQPVEVLEK